MCDGARNVILAIIEVDGVKCTEEANDMANVKDIDPAKLAEAMKQMTPDKIVKLRLEAAKAGIPLENSGGFQRMPNGDIRVTVTIPGELAEPMSQWERYGETEEKFYQTQIVEAVTAMIYGDWRIPEPAPAPAAAPAAPAPAAPVSPPPAAA